MNDVAEPAPLPESGHRKTVWPNLVWAIPALALLIVGYLGFQAFARRGEVVTVTFRRAVDARAGETKVLYQGVEAGHVIKIKPNADGRRLDFDIRLMPEAKAGLNTNARFWLIGASPTLADLSSLKAVVSGVAIGYAPGEGGTPTDTFDGLEKAPTVLPGDRGTRYILNARTLGPIHEGSVVLFHGQSIGKVTDVQFTDTAAFRVEVFVFQPYDAFVKPGVRFWKISPLRLSLAGGGVNANLAPSSTLLAGGIDLGVTTADAAAVPSPAGSDFPLYASRNAAKEGLSGTSVRYEFAFAGDAGDLDEDAPVTLLGFQIGEVESARLAYDDRTGEPYTLATASVYPEKLGLPPATVAAGRAAADGKVGELIRRGFRARLQQSPVLIGNTGIALVKVKGVPHAVLSTSGTTPRVPSAPGGTSFDDITVQADRFLTKLNGMPLESIGEDLRQVTAGLKTLVNSPKTQESLAHLTSTLAEFDHLLSQVEPEVGPLLSKLNQAAGEVTGTAHAARQLLSSDGGGGTDNLPEAVRQLTEASRSIHTLADYLDRHPEALIRGKKAAP